MITLYRIKNINFAKTLIYRLTHKTMKTTVMILLGLLLAGITFTGNAQNVTIPDANFKAALITAGVDVGGDGDISLTEAAAKTSLNVSSKNIADLTGIEAFVNLTELYCHSNKLISLDVSKNTKLTDFYCHMNQLTALDISKNTELTNMLCSFNQISSLDISKNTKLKTFFTNDNLLTSIDVSANTDLIEFVCDNNQIISIDISNNTKLTYLGCAYNKLDVLNVSILTSLTGLVCNDNNLITLDVSNNTSLATLDCSANQLSSLNILANTGLKYFSCGENPFISLDVSTNIKLIEFSFRFAQITSIDLSKNTALTKLNCYSSKLTDLNISNNVALTYVNLENIPSLINVCVWVIPFPPVGVEVYANASPNIIYSSNCGVGINEIVSQETINIFPNPVSDYVSIAIPDIDSYSVELSDITGKIYYSNATFFNNDIINVATFSKGVYLIKVQVENQSIIRKIIVQ